MVPNCVAKPKGEKRSYVCEEIHTIKDISSLTLRRPVDRGYVVNWDLQREILDHVFKKVLKINPKTCHLVLTEAPFNLPAIAAEQDKAIFDHFGFKSALICNPAGLILARCVAAAAGGLSKDARAGVVVDCGFSFAHATPIFDGRVLKRGVRRVNIGGKALTNYLKELVSYRQWNMMDEYVLMDDVKEKLCYVAPNATEELKRAKVRGPANEINKEYVLPDGVHVTRGYVKKGPARDPDAEESDDDDPDEGARRRAKKSGGGGGGKRRRLSGEGVVKGSTFVEQTLGMGNERFMVPEVLFHPSDIGLNQAGIAEAAAQAVRSVQSDLRGMLFANVVLAGGCASLPGFKERFEAELRPFVPAEDELVVTLAEDPAEMAWRGGSVVGAGADFERLAVTREEYRKDPGEFRRRYEEHVAVIRGRA